MQTYPEMNEKIIGILRISEDAHQWYAAQRIEDLEAENAKLRAELERRKLKWQTGQLTARGYRPYWVSCAEGAEICYSYQGDDWAESHEWAGPIEPPEEG